MPTWSVVWLASVPRSRAGRSAVTTTRGWPEWAASSTAGCRLATAVPDVHTTAARAPARVSPSARKAADRSSTRVWRRSSPAVAASWTAKDSGALRDPGATTTSRTPCARRAVTTARASRAEGGSVVSVGPVGPVGSAWVLTDVDPAAGP